MPGVEADSQPSAAEHDFYPKITDDEVGLLKQLHLSSLEQGQVDEAHIWGNSDDGRCLVQPGELPVIDLRLLQDGPAARAGVVDQIRGAMEEFGFFQVLNHGCPQGVVDDITAAANKFFPQSLSEKEKLDAVFDNLNVYRVITKRLDKNKLRWNEGWVFHYTQQGLPQATLAQHIYPDDPAKRETLISSLTRFGEALQSLGEKLLGLIAEGLDLEDADFIIRELRAEPSCWFGANWYPACPQPDLTYGVAPHTDPIVLAILHQDEVGGLQVVDASGRWVGVRPVPGAMVINSGDLLEAWTNGRIRSALHRSVVDLSRHRLSLLMGRTAGLDVVVRAPKQLGPPRFRPFTVAEYHRVLMEKGYEGRDNVLASFRLD